MTTSNIKVVFVDMDNTIAENKTCQNVEFYEGLYSTKRPIRIVIEAIKNLYVSKDIPIVILSKAIGGKRGIEEKIRWLKLNINTHRDINCIFLSDNELATNKANKIKQYCFDNKIKINEALIIDDNKSTLQVCEKEGIQVKYPQQVICDYEEFSYNIMKGREFMEDFKLIFTKTEEVKSPVRGHETDAGIDFFVPDNFETVTLEPGQDVLIDAGIRVVVPKGYALIFKEKSGVATKRKLTIGASVVDSDYRGNVHLHLFNNGTEPQTIEAGDKITQGLVVPVSLCQTEEVSGEVYDEYCNTERGDGGFGSTGTK